MPFSLTRNVTIIDLRDTKDVVRSGRQVTDHAALERLAKVRNEHWRVVTGVRTRTGHGRVHVVIGRAGVFSVTAERHDGEVRVDGNRVLLNSCRTDALDRATRGAEAIGSVLVGLFDVPIEVQPVLLLDGCSVVVRNDPTRVRVLHSREVPRWFRGQKNQVFTPQQRAQIETAIRQHNSPAD